MEYKSNNMELYCGDCLQLMKNIEDESIDLILCDLPYGTTRCSFDTRIPFEPLWKQYERIIKDHGAIVLFSAQPFTTDLIMSKRNLFRYEIIWKKTQKTGFYNANRMPLKAHENILVFYKHLPTYNPQKYTVQRNDIGRKRIRKPNRAAHYGPIDPTDYIETGERYPDDVVQFSNWNGALFGNTVNATKHPTQKPVPLLQWLINTYSNENDLVLDNCMGVGSTGVACMNTKRRFIGMEIDQEYYHISIKRIENVLEKINNECNL